MKVTEPSLPPKKFNKAEHNKAAMIGYYITSQPDDNFRKIIDSQLEKQ